MNDRFPALLTADASGDAALRAAGYSRSHLREGVVVSRTTLWLAASLDFPDAGLRQWQVSAERRRPQLQQILKRHL